MDFAGEKGRFALTMVLPLVLVAILLWVMGCTKSGEGDGMGAPSGTVTISGWQRHSPGAFAGSVRAGKALKDGTDEAASEEDEDEDEREHESDE